MSVENTAHDAHHGHGHDHGHGDAHGHGSLRDYLIGFFLSVVLTAIPFWLVMSKALPAGSTSVIVIAFAVVQILVHMVFFLHMNSKSENGWTLLAAIFTFVLVVITIAGSLWVMYNMNANMMPGMDTMAPVQAAPADAGAAGNAAAPMHGADAMHGTDAMHGMENMSGM